MVLSFNVGGTLVLFDVLAFLFCAGAMAGAFALKLNEPIVANPVRMGREVAWLFVSMLVVAAFVCLVSGNDLILALMRFFAFGFRYPWAVFVLVLGFPVAYMAVRRMLIEHENTRASRKKPPRRSSCWTCCLPGSCCLACSVRIPCSTMRATA